MPASAEEVKQLRRELKNVKDKIDQVEGKLNNTMKILHGLILKLKENPRVANILDSNSEDSKGVSIQSEGAGTNESGS